MYKNYEARVKEFITEMTNPSSKIVLTDLSEKIDNTRTERLKQNSLKKPFVFKGYLTELDRIRNTERNNKLLYNLPDYPDRYSQKKRKISPPPQKFNFNIETPDKKEFKPNNILANSMDKRRLNGRMSITEKNQLISLIKKDAILQPQMRFRARTDLERVYDALNGNYLRKSEREIIERQLKNIDLFNYKKPKEILKEKTRNIEYPNIDNDNKSDDAKAKKAFKETEIQNIYGPSNVYFDPKKNDKKPWARKDNLNKEARRFLSLYHVKTYFKATEEIAEYQPKNKNKIKGTCFLLPHLLPKNFNRNTIDTNENSDRSNYTMGNTNFNYSQKMVDYSDNDDCFNFAEEHQKEELDEEKNMDYDYKSKNNNPILTEKVKFDPKKVDLVTKLAFHENKNYGDENSENMLNSKKNGDEEMDTIHGISQDNIENNMNLTAKKILSECKVTSQKSRYNDTNHKTNEGKTMITKGMSIDEFRNKYNLKE